MIPKSVKKFNLIVVALMIGLFTFYLYPASNALLMKIRTHAFVYGYSAPKELALKEPAPILKPARAVPVLMYHGIINHGSVGPNTTRQNFIAQMETLKKNGYTAISVKEYDMFREGKFTLPEKPVIITFDDGRKDSFYPADEVLKELKFKATMFVATVRANNNDPFYLNWDELGQLQATGRWEIGAHGRLSHDEVLIDESGSLGKYYTSRIYVPGKGLESIEEYEKRVEEDYLNGIRDIKEHLGFEPMYFAIPLSNYGITFESNYVGAYDFNIALTKKIFKLAFTQSEQENEVATEDFYNYKLSSVTGLKRLEVHNMSPDNLLKSLERFSPKYASLAYPGGDTEDFARDTRLLYGTLNTENLITLTSSTSTPSARVIFGDSGWQDYSVEATVKKQKGRSVSLIANYIDEDNMLYLDWSEKSIKLIERAGGEERELASYYPWEKNGEVKITLKTQDGHISAYFSGIQLAKGVPTRLTAGSAGFSVWDPAGAQSYIKELKITGLNQ